MNLFDLTLPLTSSLISVSTARLYHLYGPTECLFTSTYHRVTPEDLHFSSLPIGRPLPGYRCCLVDRYLQPILCGQQSGELLIGGEAVFGGYLHRPDLTREVLMKVPKKEGIFYRTGDLVRLDLQSGLFFYVGRNDFQVKLRGQRIELGEIEAVMMKMCPEISNCVILKLHHDHSEHLVAYLQTTMEVDTNTLREECSKHLPLYMVPSLFLLIHHFPLNPNGKLDRSALPPPDFSLLLSSDASNNSDEHLRTDMERRVASIWCDVLRLPSIPSTTMSFFQLGGNSLLLIKLHHIYQSHFQLSLNITHLFRRTTLRDHLQLLHDHQLPIIDPTWQSLHITEGKG